MNEKTLDHRLAWLAGIIDGEGYLGFGVEVLRKKGEKTYAGAKWNVEVCNTDAAMLSEIMAIGDLLGAGHKWYPRARRSMHHKPMGRVSFQTKEACWTVLVATLPYLITKRSRAELMLRAIARRRVLHPEQPKQTWRMRLPVLADGEFMAMVGTIKEMNRRGTAPVKED